LFSVASNTKFMSLFQMYIFPTFPYFLHIGHLTISECAIALRLFAQSSHPKRWWQVSTKYYAGFSIQILQSLELFPSNAILKLCLILSLQFLHSTELDWVKSVSYNEYPPLHFGHVMKKLSYCLLIFSKIYEREKYKTNTRNIG